MNGIGAVVSGIDLVSVDEMRSSMDAFGRRFLDRLFTEHEIEYATSSPRAAAERLAARFAAKEACRKVLRASGRGIGWRSIEVRRSPEGWCDLALHGEALEQARAEGLSGWSVSMSHEAGCAAAVVLAVRDGRPGGEA